MQVALTRQILKEHAVLLALGLLLEHNQQPVASETLRARHGGNRQY